jgi:hypothetical protein
MYIAVVAEAVDWTPVLEGKKVKKKIFMAEVLPRVKRAFPTMFKSVRKYYAKRGREITEKEFDDILYGRFVNMFDFNPVNGKTERTGEHPAETDKEELRKAYHKACSMYRRQRVWGKKGKK